MNAGNISKFQTIVKIFRNGFIFNIGLEISGELYYI